MLRSLRFSGASSWTSRSGERSPWRAPVLAPRVGIHLGDVVEESDGDLTGDGVNIAARLEGAAGRERQSTLAVLT